MSVSALSSQSSSILSGLLMRSMDADKSGAVSADEFATAGKASGESRQSDDALARAFSSLDADGDGSLTKSEVAQGLAKFSQDGASALLGQQEFGGPPPSPPDSEDFFSRTDAAGSGTVSLEEFTSAGPEHASESDVESLFAAIDTDGDGEITGTEDEAFRASQSEGRGGPHGAGGPPPGPPPSGGAEASGSGEDDEDDTVDTLVAQLSELLSARRAYSQSATPSIADDAIASLFGAEA